MTAPSTTLSNPIFCPPPLLLYIGAAHPKPWKNAKVHGRRELAEGGGGNTAEGGSNRRVQNAPLQGGRTERTTGCRGSGSGGTRHHDRDDA